MINAILKISVSVLTAVAAVSMQMCPTKPPPPPPTACDPGSGISPPAGKSCRTACTNRAGCRACCDNIGQGDETNSSCKDLCNDAFRASSQDGTTGPTLAAALLGKIPSSVLSVFEANGKAGELYECLSLMPIDYYKPADQSFSSQSESEWAFLAGLANEGLPQMSSLLGTYTSVGYHTEREEVRCGIFTSWAADYFKWPKPVGASATGTVQNDTGSASW